MLVNILKYKCAINEIYLKEVNPKNTSKTCNKCGNIKSSEEQSVIDKTYDCSICNNICDRDYNSILNILKLGIE